jgi:hypothetical protein
MCITGQPIENGDNIHVGQSVCNGYNTELASPLRMGSVHAQVTTGQPIEHGDNIHVGQSVCNGYNTELASPLRMESVHAQVQLANPLNMVTISRLANQSAMATICSLASVGWPMCNGELSTWLVS